MSWLKPDVAEAQYELVKKELSGPWPKVYKAFVKDINYIGANNIKALLDVGCGAGHYGVICAQEWPDLNYTGTDASEHMVKIAQEMVPTGKFECREFFNHDFGAYDVVFASGVMEYTASAWDALDFLLETAQDFVILHRLHLTDSESHEVVEPTYCGNFVKKMHWNEREIRETIVDWDYTVVYESRWDDQLSLVLR